MITSDNNCGSSEWINDHDGQHLLFVRLCTGRKPSATERIRCTSTFSHHRPLSLSPAIRVLGVAVALPVQFLVEVLSPIGPVEFESGPVGFELATAQEQILVCLSRNHQISACYPLSRINPFVLQYFFGAPAVPSVLYERRFVIFNELV